MQMAAITGATTAIQNPRCRGQPSSCHTRLLWRAINNPALYKDLISHSIIYIHTIYNTYHGDICSVQIIIVLIKPQAHDMLEVGAAADAF